MMQALLARYSRYAALRWVGVVFFCCAVPIPVWALATAILREDGRWGWVLLSMGCLGLSLGSFGTANDSALYALREAGRLGALPPGPAAELAHERAVRPARLAVVHDSPVASWLIPLFALAIIGWTTSRLWGAWAG